MVLVKRQRPYWSERHAGADLPHARSVVQQARAFVHALRVIIVTFALSGCSEHGAPSFALFGAFFPAWMFCALIGIVSAICARITFVALGLAAVLPYQLFVHAAIGACVALLTWLFWFGH